MMLDTGAEFSGIFDKGAKRLGLKYSPAPFAGPINEHGTVSITDSVPVKIGAVGFTSQLPLINLPLLTRWALGKVDGLIGWPDVRDNILVFDPEQRTVSSVTELPPGTAGWLKLKIHPDNTLLLETPRPDGTVGLILVDTGSSDGVELPPAEYKKWRAAHPNAEAITKHYRMIGIEAQTAEEVRADEINLGSLTLTDVLVQEANPVAMADTDNFAGVLGMGALARMDLIVDGKSGFAYLHPKPAPAAASSTSQPPGTANNQTAKPEGDGNWTVATNIALNNKYFLAFAAQQQGDAKLTKDDYDGAIADFTHALQLDPTNAATYTNRGTAKFEKGDLDGAMADFNQGIKLDPKDAEAYDNRGWVSLQHGDYYGAITDYTHAIELNLDRPSEHVYRSMARIGQGDFTKAIQDLDDAIKLEPDDSNYPQLYRQLVRLRLGNHPTDFPGAVADWKAGWSKTIGQYLCGSVDEKALLAAAGKKDTENKDAEPVTGQQCEADYFIGMTRLLKGDQTGAREFFNKAIATGMKGYYEYDFAHVELARLDALEKK
jgi:tetratricopeptide (TPR) repeat protein